MLGLRRFFARPGPVATPTDVRDASGRQLDLVRQRLDAADVLITADHRAEASRIAQAAITPALAALDALGTLDEHTRGRLREGLEGAHGALERDPTPEREDDVRLEDDERLRRIINALTEVVRALEPLVMSPAERTRAVALGSIGSLVGAAGIGAVLWLALLEPAPPTAVASPAISFGGHDASRAIDGDPDSVWLLPDNTAGYLDVRFPEPRDLTRVRLLNVDRDEPDIRATRDYRVDFYVDGAVARTVDGRWARTHGAREWTEHEVSLERVERIRFSVVTWFPLGGGLAEMSWEP